MNERWGESESGRESERGLKVSMKTDEINSNSNTVNDKNNPLYL